MKGKFKKKKKTGTWQQAPCCTFNLVWWVYCYFISTEKNLLLSKVEFCVVMTVNIHIWKAKWKKKSKGIYEIKVKHMTCLGLVCCVVWIRLVFMFHSYWYIKLEIFDRRKFHGKHVYRAIIQQSKQHPVSHQQTTISTSVTAYEFKG